MLKILGSKNEMFPFQWYTVLTVCMVNWKISDFIITTWKVSKYGVFSGSYFPVIGLNTAKYGPEKRRIWTLFTQCKRCSLLCLKNKNLKCRFATVSHTRIHYSQGKFFYSLYCTIFNTTVAHLYKKA